LLSHFSGRRNAPSEVTKRATFNKKETIMRTKFAIPLAAAGLLLAVGEPGFAAPRHYRPDDAYASSAVTHERAITHPSDTPFGWSFPANGTAAEPLGPGHNLPYPDRPYGDPDSW
jgi:hypothetical protein